MTPTTLPKPVLWGIGATLVLGVSAGIAAWLSPRSQPQRREESRTESHSTAEMAATAELVEMVRQLQTQNATLTAQLQASTSQANDVNTRIERETIRYAPGPNSSPASVVVVRDGQPQPVGSGPSGVPVEVVKEIITSLDRSKTETDTKSETVAKTEVKTETDTSKTEKSEMMASSENSEKSETKVTVKPVETDEPARLGVGYTSARQPFVSYDLAHGPKLFGLDRVGVGALVTKGNGGGIDFGPHASVALSKGKRLQPFAGVGYKLRDRETILTVGVKF